MIADYFKARSCSNPSIYAVEASSSHVFSRHTHDRYGLGLIVSGAQRSWSGRGTVEAGRGSLITCNPGEVHDGRPMGQLRVWKMLYFEPAHIASLVSDISGASRSDFEFSQPVIPARRDHIDRFLNLYRGLTESRTELLAEERALLLFSQLLSERKSARPETYPIARARARIDDDPSVKVSLTDLAQETGLSRFQVVRGFAKQVGLTPHAYLVQRRLDTACSMVASGMRLADVAVACGFSDQSHFNRLFAKAYGLTPRSYAVAFRPPAISFKTS